MARRYDRAPIGKVRRTDEGFLIAPANLTRTGVFEYLNADGTVRREIRRPSDVFSPESLASYDRKPITRDHPTQKVTSANATKLLVGVVSNPSRADDGKHVAAEVTIYDAPTIAAIDAGTRELSPGYDVREEPIPGGSWIDEAGEIGPAGQTYRADLFQRDILVNHVAVLPRGRAGNGASIRLDSAGDQILETLERTDEKDTDMKTIKLTINGVTHEVPEQVGEEYTRLVAGQARQDAEESKKIQAELASAKAEAAARAAEIEKINGEKAGLAAKHEEATKRLDAIDATAKKAAHAELCQRAAPHAGESVETLERLDALEVQKKAVAKLAPSIKLDGVSADYVAGVFETLVAKATSGAGGNSADEAARAAAAARGEGGARKDAVDVDAKMAAYNEAVLNAWKTPAKV